ncbi:MAG TPA: hypothetical protein VIJ12_05245 [Candidatus Baltobacteraceae bacterium]
MNYDNDESLERALFALDLEQPPADLRSSILAATVYRAPAIVTLPEAAALFALVGVIGWVCVSIAMGGMPLLADTLFSIQLAVAHFFTNTVTLLWIASGGGAAIALSLWPNPPVMVRERIARR